MTRTKQLTLDGKILPLAPEEEEALLLKVKSSFTKTMVHAKYDFGVVEGKKYKAVFSSATTHIHELLTQIARECPDAVRSWIQDNQETAI